MAGVLDREIAKYETSVILKDGSVLFLRPIRPDDEDRLLALFGRLSPHTIYLRFHHVLKHMSREEAKRFSNVDYSSSFALVGAIGEGPEEKIIAVGRYYRLPKQDAAEVAFVVEDPYQQKGIGTHLLEHLAGIAREKGIRAFEAEVLAENREMLKVLTDSGFHISREISQDVYRVTMPIALTAEVEERTAEREKTATIASLRAFLSPRSIAVIGASRREGSIGNKLFRNILFQDFKGVVYPVNPNASFVGSVKAYSSIMDIAGEIDLAIIVIPAEKVHDAVQQCGRKGVQGVVVISAGFAEAGEEGKKRQQAILQTARDYGMRLVGPNCMGIINTNAGASLNGTFSPVYPPAGNIAFATQSGALGLAILEYATMLNLGLSTFVSIGNRADVSSNDLLQFWEQDPATGVILLYLESFGNPAKFARIARTASRSKPIVAVKAGRTAAGSRAAASHTGALATTEVAAEALFQQAGIIRIDTLEALFDVAGLLSHQPVPNGNRVAILTNGGGPGAMTADACASRGLDVPSLSDKTKAALRNFLRADASVANPIDMTAEATPEQYSQSLKVLASDERIDSVIVIFIPPIVTRPEEVADAIRQVAPLFRENTKTLLSSFMGARGATIKLATDSSYIPSFAFPEEAAVALASAHEYSEWLKKPKGSIPEFKDIDRPRAEATIQSALEHFTSRPAWLDADSISALLESYGIKQAQTVTASSAEDAARAVEKIGSPVAIKLLSSSITHKSEVGGVILDVRSPDDATRAFKQIRDNLVQRGKEDQMEGAVVQQMVPGGTEVIVGVTQDPSFGPLIMFGTGGVYAELFKDVTFRIHPLTDVDAAEMVRSVKAYQLLEGYRGSPPADIKALEDLLLRISCMIEDFPQISELDLNPVKALEQGKGCVVVDARIRIA